MVTKIHDLWERLLLEIAFYYKKRTLQNKNFTIISNNCWGGGIYKSLKIEYKTPFVGLFLFPECYLKLLENFSIFIKLELEFIDPLKSKYIISLRQRKSFNKYPIGRLKGTDIEIHFLHYKNQQEAIDKWNRRKKRIDINNMIVKFSTAVSNQTNINGTVARFQKLPFKHKICFVGNPGYSGCIYYPELETGKETEKWKYRKYLDIIDYLNRLKIK